MNIDAHQHFWRYSPADYGWIGDDLAVLRRDFLPADLRPELAAAGIGATVGVQARQSLRETDWLLELAANHEFIAGVVGWVPLASPEAGKELERLAANPKLKAVRHVVQDEPEGFLRGAAFNRGVALLERHGLAYDILVHAHQLREATDFVDAHPGVTFVLDHLAKPKTLSPWSGDVRRLAERPNVFCKVSGLVTEVGLETRPYLEVALEAFGPRRLLFGSDWPVCLAVCPYGRWAGVVRDFVKELSSGEQDLVMGGNAARAYKL